MVNGINNNYNQQINPYTMNNILGKQEEALNLSKAQKSDKSGDVVCKTCSERKYQDGSDDGGVSYQAPTKISPGRSAVAVASHEREHYNRESAKAKREDKMVISNTIQVFYSICPECGTKYASGGQTRTVTKGEAENKFGNNNKNKETASKVDFSI